jgi:hypothetical protein
MGATQSATQHKFLGKAGYFDGNGDYIGVDYSSGDFDVGAPNTNDFAIAAWVYCTSTSRINPIFGTTNAGTTASPIVLIILDNNHFYFALGNPTNNDEITGSLTVLVNTWYYVVGKRTGETLQLFVNGSQDGSNFTNTITPSTLEALSIGKMGQSSSYTDICGYIDELIFVKGNTIDGTVVPSRRK